MRRIPSLFQFVTQYYVYILCMLPLVGAVWGARSGLWAAMAVLISIAGLLTGQRQAFIFIPMYWFLFAILSRKFSLFARLAIVLGLCVLLTFTFLEASVKDVYALVFRLTARYSQTTASGDLTKAIGKAPLGWGAGMSTGPARHGLSDSSNYSLLSENFYAKTIYELGIPGLLIVAAIFIIILRMGYINSRLLRDTPLETFSPAFLAFFMLIFVIFSKGQYLSIDPLNVYFWVFAGLLARLPSLESESFNVSQVNQWRGDLHPART